jgi:hypothetical protein
VFTVAERVRTPGPRAARHDTVDVVGHRVAGGAGTTTIDAAVAWFDWYVHLLVG